MGGWTAGNHKSLGHRREKMIITRTKLVKTHACSDGLRFFDQHFSAGEATQEEVFEAIAKYAPTTSWQRWLALSLRLTATCRRWYPDGQPREEELYVAGKLHGLRRTWYANGKPREEETYVAGYLHGLRSSWWADGKPCAEDTWVDGKLHGLLRTWYSNGTPQVEETWEAGKRHGLRMAWYYGGTPPVEETWYRGKRVTTNIR